MSYYFYFISKIIILLTAEKNFIKPRKAQVVARLGTTKDHKRL